MSEGGGREGGREGEREGEREGGREGGREVGRRMLHVHHGIPALQTAKFIHAMQ